MADRDAVADDARDTRVGVNHRQILDVGLFTDRDPVSVAAQDRVIPDARIPADVDVAEHDRPWAINAVGSIIGCMELPALHSQNIVISCRCRRSSSKGTALGACVLTVIRVAGRFAMAVSDGRNSRTVLVSDGCLFC